jgi:hypothetical protein
MTAVFTGNWTNPAVYLVSALATTTVEVGKGDTAGRVLIDTSNLSEGFRDSTSLPRDTPIEFVVEVRVGNTVVARSPKVWLRRLTGAKEWNTFLTPPAP